jgi:hypothetical protein
MKTDCTIEAEPSTPTEHEPQASFGITAVTMKRILSQPKPADLIALYVFLAHTAKRQSTLIVYATDNFIAYGLRWSLAKVSRVKCQLKQLGLIFAEKRRSTHGKFTKHYVGVRHCDIRRAFPAADDSPVPHFSMSGDLRDKMLDDKSRNAGRKKSKETSARADASSFSTAGKKIPAVWKPDERSREEQLDALKPPRDFPSQREFEDFLASEFLFFVADYRPDLYRELCLRKWRNWNEQLNRWTPIRDWKKYVAALDAKIATQYETKTPATFQTG